jgi:hypothetical protein
MTHGDEPYLTLANIYGDGVVKTMLVDRDPKIAVCVEIFVMVILCFVYNSVLSILFLDPLL